MRQQRLLFAVIAVAGLLGAAWLVGFSSRTVDFSTQVKPIINAKCISCHGGVKAKAGFSLLFREEALAPTESGKPAIIPGDADNSELMRRILHNDPEERMPYRHEPLAKEEIAVFRKWIDQGAHWGEHWAYKPLQPVEVPEPSAFFGLLNASSDWAINPVDHFIKEKLAEHDLEPSPAADKATLLRRVSLDLTGMPAPEKFARQYLQDNSADAYERLVDSLLAAPQFGEKWASMWLDLARYADTKGYERDDSRIIWKYRDWLINAFNNDMPYDSFLIRQIAGDLLRGATDDDYIATAFHRNTMTNDEGGTENEEFRVAAVIDRVNTTWQALMGTTFSCVQCHSHPYDPFRHEEYYSFMAFFNNTRDEDTHGDYPKLRHFNDSLQQQLDHLTGWVSKHVSPQRAEEIRTAVKTWQPFYNSLLCDSFTNSELADTKWAAFRNNAVCRLQQVDLTGKDKLILRFASYVKGGILQLHSGTASGPLLASHIFTKASGNWDYVEIDLSPVTGVHNIIFTYSNANLKQPEATGLQLDWLYFTTAFPGQGLPGYRQMKAMYWQLLTMNVPETTPVMMDNPGTMFRPTRVFERGNWLVKGATVTPAVPATLNTIPQNAPANRLGLALWMVSKENPLTARTMVNRVWEQLFGTGIVETLEDMGTQGLPPTHRELLDWLSYTYMHDFRWSTKQLIRTIVLSATYRQASVVSPELQEKDPLNKWYARAPRVRLSAEQVRDQALAIAGIMSPKMYGPGVMPYQPDGIWLSPWNGASWVQSKGEDQYRRAIYTYWKRSAAYPSMIMFDGVSREVCTSRRIRTNTPLQALTTLNDSAFIDIARHFARRMRTEGGTAVKEQIIKGYTLATYHAPKPGSVQALEQLYANAYRQFRNDPAATCEMMGGMHTGTNPENAALTIVANAILNLDEVVTKN